MIIKRIFIFLLSFFWVIQTPIALAAVTPFYGPFSTAPAAADIAASLGVESAGTVASGGFAAGAAGVAAGLAAVGVGVGSFCLASAVQGANMCGVNTPICNALTGAMISCNVNPDGSFPNAPRVSNGCSSNCQYLYYGSTQTPYSSPSTATTASTYISAMIDYLQSAGISATFVSWSSGEPYQQYTLNYNGSNHIQGINYVVNPSYDPNNNNNPSEGNASASAVGAAIAGNPAAAAAVGAAAAAAAAAGCSGSYGSFNGQNTCIAGLGASSNNGLCSITGTTGFNGVVNGQPICVNALGAGNNPSCAGYSGYIGAGSATQPICVPALSSSNPSCAGSMGTYLGSPVCIGGTTAPASQSDANAQSSAAAAAASTAAANPPASRSCTTGFQLDAQSGLCVNPAIPASAGGCAKGYIASKGTCVPADPLNPTKPAVPTTADPTQPASAANPAFPAFCGWAATVCDLVNFIKAEPVAPTSDNVVTVVSSAPPALQSFDMNKSYFNFGSSCPPDKPVSFSLMGHSTTINLTWQPICTFLGDLKPFIIACSFIAGAFIVAGVQRPSGED